MKSRYRLIKPDWANFPGPKVKEGYYSQEELKENNELGYNIFFFPNYPSKKPDHKFLQGTDIDVFDYVFVDMDLKDGVYPDIESFLQKLEQFPIKPNTVTLSGNGAHAYWRVTDLDRPKFLETQLRLIQEFNTDKSVWTVLQLMRLPGYYNTKDQENFKLAEQITMSEESVSYDTLDVELPTITTENQAKLENHENMLSGVKSILEDDVDTDELPPRFIQIMEKSNRVQEWLNAPAGERSEADWLLAKFLFKRDFTRQEATQILANTNKALEKGPNRLQYAATTVVKAYSDQATHSIPSAREYSLNFKSKGKDARVNGPKYLDCLHNGWRKKQMLGLIGSSGGGKTSLTLDIFYNLIKNNPENDDIFVFFSLEMSFEEVFERWEAITESNPEYAERLYIVANEDENGDSRDLGLQEIYLYLKDIKKVTGKSIAAAVIDHIGIIKNTVDVKIEPNFGLLGDSDEGGTFGSIRSVSPRKLTKVLKQIAKKFDTFLIVQSQTTKTKAGQGDTPLGLDAAYGAAQFEWDMDYILTIWQPLRRVEAQTDLRLLSFQYAKIRSKNAKDPIGLMEPQLLQFHLDTGRLNEYYPEVGSPEEEELERLLLEALKFRKEQENKGTVEYNLKRNVAKLKKLLNKSEEPADSNVRKIFGHKKD